ncbi:hypothetical protein EVAR_19258_1 [Eumeta japonica]|uniref:Uncharacterized protein n=1 Tax=Eumeta variegata TaxID=151549 RepID=A0A4C1UEM6_EUMVA|nr:hypothetical protein EVAR_19258_1 [Eumeta japonica]
MFHLSIVTETLTATNVSSPEQPSGGASGALFSTSGRRISPGPPPPVPPPPSRPFPRAFFVSRAKTPPPGLGRRLDGAHSQTRRLVKHYAKNTLLRGRPIIVEWERRKAFGGPLSFVAPESCVPLHIFDVCGTRTRRANRRLGSSSRRAGLSLKIEHKSLVPAVVTTPVTTAVGNPQPDRRRGVEVQQKRPLSSSHIVTSDHGTLHCAWLDAYLAGFSFLRSKVMIGQWGSQGTRIPQVPTSIVRPNGESPNLDQHARGVPRLLILLAQFALGQGSNGTPPSSEGDRNTAALVKITPFAYIRLLPHPNRPYSSGTLSVGSHNLIRYMKNSPTAYRAEIADPSHRKPRHADCSSRPLTRRPGLVFAAFRFLSTSYRF